MRVPFIHRQIVPDAAVHHSGAARHVFLPDGGKSNVPPLHAGAWRLEAAVFLSRPYTTSPIFQSNFYSAAHTSGTEPRWRPKQS